MRLLLVIALRSLSLQKLPNLQQMPYQCSESSTASEVAAVFDNAVSRARAMKQHSDIILVFLDVSMRQCTTLPR